MGNLVDDNIGMANKLPGIDILVDFNYNTKLDNLIMPIMKHYPKY